MERLQYCVYNQTNECFLSLGVIRCENVLARLKGMRGRLGLRFDEGAWITRPRGIHTVSVFSARDLIYLDQDNRVISVIESSPALRLAPYLKGAASVLALPVRSIRSSQTQPGNQLVICIAEEMEFRLRSISGGELTEPGTAPASTSPASGSGRFLQGASKERRRAVRRYWPRLVAFDAAGGPLPVHGIRDISSTGMYLMTKERWPLGSHVRMSLQRTDSVDDDINMPITVDMRVARWGADGVGLEFLQADMAYASAWESLGDESPVATLSNREGRCRR